VEQEGHSSSSSHPKGQWERRLQTDIQTAKQALCEALSLTPATHAVTETRPSSSSHEPYIHASSSYASSYENISRLMENWMKTPNSNETISLGDYSFNNMVNNTPRCSSSEGAHSTTNTTFAQDHAFDLFTFNSPTNYGSPSQTQVPLTMIENWLFEDGTSHSHEDLMGMSLEESTSGLF